MAFVQIIEFRTSDIERARQVNDEWWRATEGKRTVRRELLARDHSDPSHCFAVVFFDSYESAMENSNLPETQASAEQYMKISDGPPVFYDLDILEDRSLGITALMARRRRQARLARQEFAPSASRAAGRRRGCPGVTGPRPAKRYRGHGSAGSGTVLSDSKLAERHPSP